MRNLYTVDLKRILKDKLFLVSGILALAFAVLSPLVNKLLFSALGISDLLGETLTAKTMTFGAFAPGDNLGLVVPILISIIVCKDFSHGTVRNKIISGKSRRQIYLSHLLASATAICAIMLLHALLTLLVSLCFFPYQETAFTFADFGYFMISILFELIVYFAVSAIVTFIAMNAKNMGICIVLYLAVSFGLAIIGAIFQVAGVFLSPEDNAYGVIEFINAFNFYTSTLIGTGASYTFKQVIYILLSPIVVTVGCTLLGVFKFNRKNLK